MSELKDNNTPQEESEKPRLCSICLQFFGVKHQDYLCSKCYKDKQKPLKEAVVEDKEVSVRKESAELSPPIEEPKPKEDIKLESEKVKQEEPSKCFSCDKKVGIMGYQCKCSHLYCKKHRLPEDHDCTYDFMSEGKNRLKDQNPLVMASKLEKF